ncbi:MAG: hemerythrin domain-containing protein [Methanomassiliicoccales archaeon]
MLPIGPLMMEHRRIERMVSLLHDELDAINRGRDPDLDFLEDSIDFMRSYADRCHHGKEEGILFKELKHKNLPEDLRKIMDDLVHDHEMARENVNALERAGREYDRGRGPLEKVTDRLEFLVHLYPRHIGTEDKQFFIPCMDHFTEGEQQKMLERFFEFDRDLIHQRYETIVGSYEE